jgi:hypothetical protein
MTMSRALRNTRLLPFAVLGLALAAPVSAHDNDRVRRAGVCTKSSSAQLELSAEGRSGGHSGRGRQGGRSATIAVTFTVRSQRSGVTWRVILLHERRTVYHGELRTHPPKGTFVLSRSLPDWYGSEVVTARALSPRGEICVASARI